MFVIYTVECVKDVILEQKIAKNKDLHMIVTFDKSTIILSIFYTNFHIVQLIITHV